MTTNAKPIKILLAKLGLDGHDRGVKVVAKALQDAGMEVEYLGMRLTPEEVAEAAERESADVIGISLLSGAHKPLMDKLVKAVRNREMLGETLILLGGTVGDDEVTELQEMGVDGIFPVGSSLKSIIKYIEETLRQKA
jgi:methylmalonyl-CoA mutase C-terminal domain/subunit